MHRKFADITNEDDSDSDSDNHSDKHKRVDKSIDSDSDSDMDITEQVKLLAKKYAIVYSLRMYKEKELWGTELDEDWNPLDQFESDVDQIQGQLYDCRSYCTLIWMAKLLNNPLSRER